MLTGTKDYSEPAHRGVGWGSREQVPKGISYLPCASEEFLSALGNAPGYCVKSPRSYIWSAIREILKHCCLKMPFVIRIYINRTVKVV